MNWQLAKEYSPLRRGAHDRTSPQANAAIRQGVAAGEAAVKLQT
ncbi:MAG: hypothetical protein WKF84_27880 [Pyrinomonadaceae bacterium]